MKRDPNKAAVITMIRQLEFPAAWSSLNTIEPQLGPDTVHFLLLNNERDAELEARLRERPHTRLITPGHNLGVAVGRNALIRAALEWGAETIFSLDDDLLVPADYIVRIRRWIDERKRSGERIGIVAPAVLDFHAAARQIMSLEETEQAESGRFESFIDTETLQTRLREAWSEDVPLDAVYHAGIRNWRHHYLEMYRLRATQIRSLFYGSRGVQDPDLGISELRLDPNIRKAIVAGDSAALRIDTAAGGACAYTADLLEEIGGIDEAFSPFGYEDSDFAIRSVKAGFSNYSLPNEVLLHDLDSRQKTRSPAVVLHSQGRARGLIGRKHLPESDRVVVLAETAALAAIQAVDLVGATSGAFPSPVGGAIGAAVAYLSGLAEGLFTAPSEAAFSNAPRQTDYLTLPTDFKRRFSKRFRTWHGTPAGGLPSSFLVDFDIAWSWDRDRGRLRLTRLQADAPGLFRIQATAEILGIGTRDASGNADPLSSSLAGARLVVEDWGFLRAAQTTAAWFRNERTTGYLAPLLRRPVSQLARSLQWFLSFRDTPARFDMSIDPPTPISVGDLLTLPPSMEFKRSIGFRAMVSEIAYY
jgi:GT2 family glycosyltransferase